jgi:hypothetical protein
MELLRPDGVVGIHTGAPKRMKISEGLYVCDGSGPLSILLYFMKVITLLVVETNHHHFKSYVNILDK